MPRLAGAALFSAVWFLVALPVGAAQQVTASVDVGVARVDYDGFLPSGAASVSPAVRVINDNLTFTARGTWLGFESGNTSLQGLVAGSVFTRPSGHWRGEFSGAAGTSVYAGFLGFAHLLGRARLHYLSAERGFWLAGTFGSTYLSDEGRPVRSIAVGFWNGQQSANIALALGTTTVGDTSYTDLEGSGYWRAGRLELEASVGARGGRGGGRGVYGEATALIAFSPRLGLTLAGGRYPTDPIRGSVSGRYVSAGLRLSTLSARAISRTDPSWPHPPVIPITNAEGTDGHLATAELGLEPGAGGMRLVVIAPAAQLVEVMGDFTEWQPVALRVVGGKWRLEQRLPSGLRRLNVRVDGGPWSVPVGATAVLDDYDGLVGTIVVP